MTDRKQLPEPGIVKSRSNRYQPTKAGKLEENVKIAATPDELARAVLSRVKIVRDCDFGI